MRRSNFLAVVLLAAAMGCGASRGSGAWDLKLGGEARLVSADGSAIALEGLSAEPAAKGARRGRRTAKAVTNTAAPGTRVLVLAIDGDDARVEIKDGPLAGTVHWVPCAQLESSIP